MIYKVESATPIPGARNIRISTIMPPLFENETTTKGREAENLRDSLVHLATVEYRTIRTFRIRMGDLDAATNDCFRREGWSLTSSGRLFFLKTLEPHCLLATSFRNRVFTEPDGRKYLWKLGEMSCEK